jgi:glycosyltransferase involved in cell wall biosynthesis
MVVVKQVCPAAELLLVGDGEVTQELKQQAKEMGLEGSITWVGRVPYWEVPTWIGAMSVCVAPFREDRGETSPVKLFDYLACHRPVVASAIPSVLSTFTQDSGVRLVRPDDPRLLADAILALLSDPALCALLGKQGRQFVEERFSWTVIVEQFREWVSQDRGVIRHAHSHVL